MAFKGSIIGFAALAFFGPVILFITAFLVYKRVKQHRESSKLSNIGGDDHHWHEDLKKKSDLSRLTNMSEVPLVVIEAKRGPARSYSNGSSMIAAQSTESSSPASSTIGSSSSRGSPRGCSPERTPQGTPRSPALLTPPPAAAVHAPGDCTLEPQALLQQQATQQQELVRQQQQPAQQQQQQQGGHCVVQMPVVNGHC